MFSDSNRQSILWCISELLLSLAFLGRALTDSLILVTEEAILEWFADSASCNLQCDLLMSLEITESSY